MTKVKYNHRETEERERLELGQLIGKPVQTFVEPVPLDRTGCLDVPLKYFHPLNIYVWPGQREHTLYTTQVFLLYR